MMNKKTQKVVTDSYVEYAKMHQTLRDEKVSHTVRAQHEGAMDALVNSISGLTGIANDQVFEGVEIAARRYREDTVLPLMKLIWANEGTAERPKKWDDLFEYPVNDSERAQIMDRLSRSAKAVLSYCTTAMGEK